MYNKPMNSTHASLTLSAYSANREGLLTHIHQHLEADPRFMAAWLGGSYGRGEQDSVSDLDLFVVVQDGFAFPLCRRQAAKASGTTPERLELFRQFGEIANIHENHANAPLNGTFSAVLYRDPPVIVDWVLAPQTGVVRPPATRLLFDRANTPSSGLNETGDSDRADRLAEGTAFFWMMAAVTTKYIVRGNAERVQELLMFVEAIVGEIAELAGRPVKSCPAFSPDLQSQSAFLLHLCDEVEASTGLPEEVSPPTPRGEVEAILNLRA
jgi:hypothetical protein